MINKAIFPAGIAFILILASFCYSTTTFIWIRNDSLAQGRDIAFTEPQKSAEIDLDNDGDLDLISKSESGGWSISTNINGAFEEDSERFSDWYKSVKIYDINRDGLDDFIFKRGKLTCYINKSVFDSLRFDYKYYMFSNTAIADNFEFADFDSDGDYDLAILSGKAVITYENKSTDDSKNEVLKWDERRNLPNPFGGFASVVFFEMSKSDSVYIQVFDRNFKEYCDDFVGFLEKGTHSYGWVQHVNDKDQESLQGIVYCRIYTRNEEIIIPRWYVL